MLTKHVRGRSINPGHRLTIGGLSPRFSSLLGLLPLLLACAAALPPTPTSLPAPPTVMVASPTIVPSVPQRTTPPMVTPTPTALPPTSTLAPPTQTPGLAATALSTAGPIPTPTTGRVAADSSATVDNDADGIVRAFVAALARNDRAAMLQLTTSRGSRFIPADAADLIGAIEVRTIRSVGAASSTRREMLVALTVQIPGERIGSWTKGNNARFMELTRAVGQDWRINEIATSPIGSVETMGPPPVLTPGRG